MAGKFSLIKQYVERLERAGNAEELVKRLEPRKGRAVTFPGGTQLDTTVLARRWKMLGKPEVCEAVQGGEGMEWAAGHIENGAGVVCVPVGVAGPLRVNGLYAQGDYWVPLATTEAALVASYHRGCRVLTAAGGCTAVVLAEAVTRAPAFVFTGVAEAGRFIAWVTGCWDDLKRVAEEGTRYGKLVDMGATMEGNTVWLTLEYTTGDASGQNMVTICTERVCGWISQESPIVPRRMYVEGNLSGDKKASAQAFTTMRGRKVVAEVRLSAELLGKFLHVTPVMMTDYWRLSAMGGVLSGTMGVQGHFANGLAALYLATGQDVACVAEGAVGVTRFELDGDGLYACVTLPSVMVGTVGGGTGLPTQRAWLELMGLAGAGGSGALAEVCAGLLLAGELSIIAALAAGHFVRAHAKLARGRAAVRS